MSGVVLGTLVPGNCVAVGWPPPTWSFDGPNEDSGGKATPFLSGWTYACNRLKEIRPGDKVIPFLLKWRHWPC